MKTKLLRKFRKRANQNIYIQTLVNTWDRCSTYRVVFGNYRAKHFNMYSSAIAFATIKRREFILKQNAIHRSRITTPSLPR